MNPIFHELFQRSRLLNKELNSVLKQYGLFASQWSVLFCVHLNGQMTLTEIWTYLNVEAPTITRTVQRLEELGWLHIFHGADRREKVVTLSDQAIRQFPKLKETVVSFENRFLNNLPLKEQDELVQLLHKLNIEKEIDM